MKLTIVSLPCHFANGDYLALQVEDDRLPQPIVLRIPTVQYSMVEDYIGDVKGFLYAIASTSNVDN